MKLHNLKRGAKFTVELEDEDGVFELVTLDGMYSICKNDKGETVHWAAFTPVVPMPGEGE